MFSRASIPKSLARWLAIALLFIAFFVADVQPGKADSVYSTLNECTNIFSGAVSSKDTMRVSIINNCKECVDWGGQYTMFGGDSAGSSCTGVSFKTLETEQQCNAIPSAPNWLIRDCKRCVDSGGKQFQYTNPKSIGLCVEKPKPPPSTNAALHYGDTYYIKNEYAYKGQKTYLDTNGSGCEGNAMCVSTSSKRNRAYNSGQWKILSPSGKKGAVQCGDIVYLQNQYKNQGKFTYLDTKESGCEGNALCVSASFSSDRAKVGTGKWKLICTGGDIKKPVSLQNQAKFQGKSTYLDTNGSGCEDVFCVSASLSPDRANVGTGKWAFELAARAPAPPQPKPAASTLRYDGVYNIRNEYAARGKTYLDTRKAGCEGNALCVSTATSPNRANVGTAKWKILSASGKKGAVQCNDIVYLQNQAKYQGKFTYLDTNRANCESNAFCVSASFSPDRAKVGTGKWKLICTGEDIKKPVSLQNQYKLQGKFTYLDTRGAGCESNVFCVSTSFSPDRAKVGTGKWSILPAK